VPERVGDSEGEPSLLPGHGRHHIFACDRLGKDLGERERDGSRIDLEKRDPQRLRQDPSLRVGVKDTGKERRLDRRDSRTGTARPQIRKSFE